MAALTRFEERKRRRQELIEVVRAMLRHKIGGKMHRKIQDYFMSMDSFCEEAGLKPCRRPQKRKRKKPQETRKGQLRAALGAKVRWKDLRGGAVYAQTNA